MYQFPTDYEWPSCDLCGSDTVSRKTLIPQAKGTECSLVECTNCGLRFFSPRPKWSIIGPMVADEREQAQRLYDTGSFLPVPDVAVQIANIKSYYMKMLDDVKGFYGRVPETMFEVGGLVGWFARYAAEFGVKLIDGCDLNPHGVALARQQPGMENQSGYVAGDFGEYVPTRQYELVVALDFLEHTYYPWQDLQKLASMIEPGGVLLLKTFLDDLDVNREMLSPPTHSVHWVSGVLRGAIERTGLVIKDWRIDYNYMPIVIAMKLK
jgi:SAM-dependent methyltransferase